MCLPGNRIPGVLNSQNMVIGCQWHFQAVSLIVRVELMGKWYIALVCMICFNVFCNISGNRGASNVSKRLLFIYERATF